jgi:peroxiredoxin
VRSTRLISLVLVVAFAVFSAGLKRTLVGRDSAHVGAYGVGTTAPDFTLPDVNGKPVSFHEVSARNDITLVNFRATRCMPCRLETPELTKTWKRHGKKGLALLAVSTDENTTKVRLFVVERHLAFPVLADDGSVSKQYDVKALPTSLMVDRNAKVVWVHAGIATDLSATAARHLARVRTRAKAPRTDDDHD